VECGARDRLRVPVTVEQVGALARVAGRVAAAATELADTARDGDRHRHPVLAEPGRLVVLVDAGDEESDRQDRHDDEAEPDDDRAEPPAVDRSDAGAAERRDAVGVLRAGGVRQVVALVRRVGGP
jgi:hypothetical protein